MVMDLVKMSSDDTYFTEDHVLFLINKFRMYLLKQKYEQSKNQAFKILDEADYSTVTVDLQPVGEYLQSIDKVPTPIGVGVTKLFTNNFSKAEIALVSYDRFNYVGHNKYLQNIIYAAIAPDNKLMLWSENPQFSHLEKINMKSVFENPEEASNEEDIMEANFPLEEGLIPALIEAVVKELLGAAWRPQDNDNNANDDIADLAAYVRRNLKNNFQKQISGDD